jgi:hypothetical protein
MKCLLGSGDPTLDLGARGVRFLTIKEPTMCLLSDPLRGAEREAWLNAPLDIALGVQRRCPTDLLRVVATGERKDGLAA